MSDVRCAFPGCRRKQGLAEVLVGPDLPFASEATRIEDARPQVATDHACEEHVELVLRMLQERDNPRLMALHEGRP